MTPTRICIVGGGAAGFFAAITCAQAAPQARVAILEKGPRCLSKVLISGGGRCNVTHACFDPRELAAHYPRGQRAMTGLFSVFQPRDTVAWFSQRGVELKTEKDGRMFPASNSSETIVQCLLSAAASAHVDVRLNSAFKHAATRPEGGFLVTLQNGSTLVCDLLMLATGGCKSAEAASAAASLGHTLESPVPSLFTFNIQASWIRDLAGISVENVEISVPGTQLRERGPVLLTHWGLSGPAVLRLSAWGARALKDLDYRFPILLNWLPRMTESDLTQLFSRQRQEDASRRVSQTRVEPLPARLWEALASAAGVAPETRWSAVSNAQRHSLVQQLLRTQLQVSGKSANKDEFVTCGGIPLREVNIKTMESRLCPGLYFGGELLDIDGLTGGFNFQSAWTTGWIAGKSMAQKARHLHGI